ncbi:hypothetical protein CXF46_05790 [Corynebacterium bovis]|nr:hypothetical protein CXF46_05790 [Corynebacterium bovis]
MPLVGAGALPVSALSPVVVPAAQAAPAAGGAECRPVTRGTVGWGIRQSFRRYLTGPVAGGSWTLDGVGFRGGARRVRRRLHLHRGARRGPGRGGRRRHPPRRHPDDGRPPRSAAHPALRARTPGPGDDRPARRRR